MLRDSYLLSQGSRFLRYDAIAKKVGRSMAKSKSARPPLKDDVLGCLEWDKDSEWFSILVNLGELQLEFCIDPGGGDLTSRLLNRARQVFTSLERYAKLAKDFAVEGLLELKNDVWLEEDEEPLLEVDFRSRMTLESIIVGSEGDVSFYHHDGDLFWGHCIEVDIDERDRCVGTNIPG